MNPIKTEYHKVKRRIKIVNEIAVEIVNPCKLRSPISVLSETPRPAGIKDATPSIIDVAYVGITSKILSRSIPKDFRIK